MAVVTPLNNFLGPEGDTVTMDEQLLNTEYWTAAASSLSLPPSSFCSNFSFPKDTCSSLFSLLFLQLI